MLEMVVVVVLGVNAFFVLGFLAKTLSRETKCIKCAKKFKMRSSQISEAHYEDSHLDKHICPTCFSLAKEDAAPSVELAPLYDDTPLYG